MSNILWVDLETTGLDPSRDLILEVAIVVTDRELTILDRWESCVAVDLREAKHLCDPFVFKMHTQNDLFKEIEYGEGETLQEIEQQIILLAEENDAIGGPCAGSTPQFDRSFLKEDLPNVDKLFNHRVLDVSSFAFWQDLPREKRDPAHRAMADVLNSIETLRSMRGQTIR